MKLDNRPSVFKVYTVDLGCGESEGGLYKQDIDSMFKEENDDHTIPCYICGKVATHRLIPKYPHLDNEQIRKQGYVCANCLEMKYVNGTDYGIRPLSDNKGNPSMMLI